MTNPATASSVPDAVAARDAASVASTHRLFAWSGWWRALAGLVFTALTFTAVVAVEHRRLPALAVTPPAPTAAAATVTITLTIEASYPVAAWTVLVNAGTVTPSTQDERSWRGEVRLPRAALLTVQAEPTDAANAQPQALRLRAASPQSVIERSAWGSGTVTATLKGTDFSADFSGIVTGAKP